MTGWKLKAGALVLVAATTLAMPMMAQDAPAAATDEETSNLIALGKEIFEVTAGDIGCAYCHGMDARGNLEIGGPIILGASEELIKEALGRVDIMNFITLSDEEASAIAAYLFLLHEMDTH
jgi:mono/diheme cytochrome c family protein